MEKYYKVLQDTFMWEKGAILTDQRQGHYVSTNPIWNKLEEQDEYISDNIVENQPEWFERVHKVDLLTKIIYATKEKAKELLAKNFE